jgi:nicotinate dehydrogenase subunit B
VNPARTADQVIGAPTQGTSQALIEQVIFNTSSVTSLDWVTYLVLRFKEDPKVTPIVLQRPDHGTHGGGEEPITAVFAAIANAFFDATGVRLRQTPMTRPSSARRSRQQASRDRTGVVN